MDIVLEECNALITYSFIFIAGMIFEYLMYVIPGPKKLLNNIRDGKG